MFDIEILADLIGIIAGALQELFAKSSWWFLYLHVFHKHRLCLIVTGKNMKPPFCTKPHSRKNVKDRKSPFLKLTLDPTEWHIVWMKWNLSLFNFDDRWNQSNHLFNSTNCKLPECLCMSSSAPNGLKPEEIPQLVFLTFDDAISDWMYPIYDRILRNRKNPNGCPVTMTFYVTHEATNYQLVNEFFNKGNEIASHSVRYFQETISKES